MHGSLKKEKRNKRKRSSTGKPTQVQPFLFSLTREHGELPTLATQHDFQISFTGLAWKPEPLENSQNARGNCSSKQCMHLDITKRNTYRYPPNGPGTFRYPSRRPWSDPYLDKAGKGSKRDKKRRKKGGKKKKKKD